MIWLLALCGLVASPAWGGRPAPDGWRFAERQLAKIAKHPRTRFVVVVDLDYTVLDPRPRTQAALKAFGLGHVPLRSIRWDGRETALRLGLDARTADRFHRFWRSYFWSARNLHHDDPLSTARLLTKAKAMGAEVVYLTGRNRGLAKASSKRLAALGFPDPQNVVGKRKSQDTVQFKVSWLRGLRRHGKQVLWYMTDTPNELHAIRGSRVGIPLLFVRGLVTPPHQEQPPAGIPELRGIRKH